LNKSFIPKEVKVKVRAYLAEDETRYRDMETGTVLVRIATEKLTRIEKMLTEMVDDNLPLVSVTVASNPNYLLTITKWNDDEIHYSVEVENDTTQDVDHPRSTSQLLEGCPTDEEIQLMQDAADQEQAERDAWYKEHGTGKDWDAHRPGQQGHN